MAIRGDLYEGMKVKFTCWKCGLEKEETFPAHWDFNKDGVEEDMCYSCWKVWLDNDIMEQRKLMNDTFIIDEGVNKNEFGNR